MSMQKTSRLSRYLRILSCTVLPFVLSPAHAAPGTLSQVPLFTGTVVEPNIMFLFDNSGSMNNIVPEAPYDPNTDYSSACNAEPQVIVDPAVYTQIDVGITSAGSPFFSAYDQGDDDWDTFDWGTTPNSNGANGNPERCFDPDESYNARLNGNGGGSGENKYPSGYLDAEYDGNYLNWYFGSSPTSWGSDARLKKLPDATRVQSRLTIAQDTATDLINNSLNDVRVGLASYNSGDGATINVGVASLDATQRTALVTEIAAMSASGNTPLAESLQDIGRYFVGLGGTSNPGNQTATNIASNGQYDGNLTLHPDAASPTTLDDDTVFDHTPAFDSGVSNESPILYWCQKNFSILMSDGRPQGDQDISAASGLQDYDGDCDNADPACGSHDQKDASLGYDYESEGSDYLDDVAQALYEIDLRPDIDNFDGDEVLNNMRTYTIGFADDQVINDPLIRDTAEQGGGQFLTGADSEGLQSAFNNAIADIIAKIGSAAAVTFNSGNITTNSSVFLALFSTYNWSGQLLGFSLNGLNGDIVVPAQWDAAVELDERDLSVDPRVILTYGDSDGDGAADDGVAFGWANLSFEQQSDLCMGPVISGCTLTDGPDPDSLPNDAYTDTAEAEARLAYLRGDRSHENSASSYDFRDRGSRLGDIVHAGPVFVGEPEVNWPDGLLGYDTSTPPAPIDPYSAFAIANENRTPVVYVGGNDGMLHGFDANSGEELLAYIPHALFSDATAAGLHYLTDPDYGHRFYVDLQPTISDAYTITRPSETSGSDDDWHTILIGGLRAGGRGYFALDITDPTTFSQGNAADIVMWEFTSADDADLGHSYSSPVIAMLENDRWAAIFGNGYEDSGTNGTAQLFIVYLDGGLDGVWTEGTDYLKIDTETGSVIDRNGLGSPAVLDLSGNGKADRVYAGDLHGKMWAFDLSDSSANNWDVAYKAGSTPVPLLSTASNQPITSAPMIIRHPSVDTTANNAPNVMVLFGTGQYLVAGDTSSTDGQSFYGVWDEGSDELDRSDLIAQTFETGSFVDGNNDAVSDVRVLTDNAVPYSSTGPDKRYGWYIDLPSSGERVVVNPIVRGSTAYFNTLIPSDTPCRYGGSGWLMSVNTTNGGRTDGAPFDTNSDGIVDGGDLLSGGDSSLSDVAAAGELVSIGLPAESTILADYQYTPTTATAYSEDDDGGARLDDFDKRTIEGYQAPYTGRLSWKELENH